MTQPVNLDEQRDYQAPSSYNSTLYQGQQAYSGVLGGSPEQATVQSPAQAATSRHGLILGICSLAALAVAVVAFVSALETVPIGSLPLFALLGLGVVSVAVVAINVTFHFRR